jgi:hypothetical protein
MSLFLQATPARTLDNLTNCCSRSIQHVDNITAVCCSSGLLLTPPLLLLLLLLQPSKPAFGGFSFSKPAEPAPAPAAPAAAPSSSFSAPPDPWKSSVRYVTMFSVTIV